MQARKSQAIGIAAIVLAVVTLLTAGVLCYQDWKRYAVADMRVHDANQILTLTEHLVSRMLDAETGQRGFLLTGRPEYLQPYHAALAQLPAELHELDSLSSKQDAGLRDQFLELRQLIDRKTGELSQTIEIRESSGLAAALDLVDTNQGKQTMDQIRRVAQDVETAQTRRWSAAWDDLRSGAEQLRLVTLLGAVLMVLLVTIGGAALKNAVDETQRLVVQLDASKRAAEQGRDLLNATLYSIGDGVITTDSSGAVQMMNAVAERLTGITEAEARGKDVEQVFQIVNEASRHTVENPIRRVLKDGQVVGLANHTVLIPRNGPAVPIDDSAAPIRGSDGSSSGVVLVFRDVSERKKAADTARRMASIVENSDDAIIGKTLDGIVTSWNRAAERLFGYSGQEMIGSSIARLIPADRGNDMEEILKRIRDGESVDHYETERIAKDGRRMSVALTVSPIRDADGRIVGASKIARDVTEQRQLEQIVRQNQKMEAVGRLAGGLAHDFNNLLTVILGYAATLNEQLPTGDPRRRSVAEILRAGGRAASLTGQLLAFSRKQVVDPRVLDLNDLLLENRDMLERMIGEDVDLALALDPEPCFIKLDSNQLAQILMNLAINARDAMPQGGKLTFEARTLVRDREDLGARGVRPAGRYALLAVSDTGAGMTAETAAHIFEPFFTTKEAGKGTGLGLATVYGIVTQHGGWIDVYSEPGHGAVFKIYFPRVEAGQLQVLETMEKTGPSPPATILLVEDQAPIRLLAEDILTAAGHRVLSASNGRAALERADRYPDRIDLLVTDVVMPEMSGPDLVYQLSRSRPELSVLFISGYTDHALLRHGTIERGTAFLQKPFLPDGLVQKVNSVLRDRDQARRTGT